MQELRYILEHGSVIIYVVLGFIANSIIQPYYKNKWKRKDGKSKEIEDIIEHYKRQRDYYKSEIKDSRDRQKEAETTLEKEDMHWKKMHETLMMNIIAFENQRDDLMKQLKECQKLLFKKDSDAKDSIS